MEITSTNHHLSLFNKHEKYKSETKQSKNKIKSSIEGNGQ